MKKRMLVMLSVLLVATLVLAGCGKKYDYSIAINQWVEHPSLDATREGFLDALKDAGIVEGENLKVDFSTAQQDSGNNSSIVQNINSKEYDVVLAIATPSARTTATEISKMPVLFSAVTDPIKDEIVSNLERPGGNVTGASDTNPDAIVQLMDFIGEHFPDIRTIGLIINTGESNAVIMADQAEEALKKHNITMERAAVATSADVKQAAESLVGRVDALYITLDNAVVLGLNAILEVAQNNNLPFFASDRDSVEAGAFATVGFRYYDHGYQVGEMAADIILNGKDPGEMEVKMPDYIDLILNLDAAEKQGITVTDSMLEKVKNKDINIIQ